LAPLKSADQGDASALDLCKSSPDTEWLPNLEGMLEATLPHRTHSTNGLRLDLSPLALLFPLEGRWGKEEVSVVPSAKCP
jgi:hypothetical protein